MSERSHDPEPMPAALDELARAFGLGDDESGPAHTSPARRRDDSPAMVSDDLDHDADLDHDRDDDDHDDHDVAEHVAEDVAEHAADGDDAAATAPVAIVERDPSPATEPLRVIRIDDITGSVGVGDATPAPTGPSLERTDPDADPGDPADRPAPSVISIDTDDLPDAVYVAGSLEGGSNRAIVFIEDDTAGDALQPESDRDLRRGIEPRLRERRVQVKRAQSRKRLKWVVAGAGLVVVGIGVLAVLGSTLFAVQPDQITVTGNVYADPDRLESILDDLAGTPSLRVDTQRIEREIETIPWVDDAKVRVEFPRSATIEIRERQAMATYQGPDQRFRVLDRDGRVLDVLEKWPIAYVLVTGPDPIDLEAGQFAPQGYVGAAELAKNLTGSVRGQVERIDVTADGQRLSMFLTDGTEVRFGEARDLFTKLVRLETRLADPDREPGPIDVATN